MPLIFTFLLKCFFDTSQKLADSMDRHIDYDILDSDSLIASRKYLMKSHFDNPVTNQNGTQAIAIVRPYVCQIGVQGQFTANLSRGYF